MTIYMFTLSDKTPAVEIDVKETAIAQGAGQDLYERAKKELGYSGTFEEFLASFKGDTGERGIQGERGMDGLPGAKGDKGDTGERGADGLPGAKGDTGERGADGLPGAKGERGADGAVGAKGEKGDTGERGQDGLNGKSAYEIAVANGYVGSEDEWLSSLKGDSGSSGRDGKSAFESSGGYQHFDTESEWVASLKGAKGDDGKSATVTIGTVTTGETASVTNTGTESEAVLNFVLPAGGGGNNGLHTEIRTIPVTVNAQQIQTVEFEAKFAETPTLHGQPALMGAGENRFLYLLSVDKNGFTCRSNYFSAGVQTIHYAVTGKLA